MRAVQAVEALLASDTSMGGVHHLTSPKSCARVDDIPALALGLALGLDHAPAPARPAQAPLAENSDTHSPASPPRAYSHIPTTPASPTAYWPLVGHDPTQTVHTTPPLTLASRRACAQAGSGRVGSAVKDSPRVLRRASVGVQGASDEYPLARPMRERKLG